MLKIRLQRTGRKNSPAYRIVVAEHTRPVQGKYLEILGHYLPTRKPAEFKVDAEQVAVWIKRGAQPTDTMARLLHANGVKGMESFVKQYTKKKKRNPSEEEIAAEEAKNNPPAPEPETKEGGVVEPEVEKEANPEPVAEEKPAEPETKQNAPESKEKAEEK